MANPRSRARAARSGQSSPLWVCNGRTQPNVTGRGTLYRGAASTGGWSKSSTSARLFAAASRTVRDQPVSPAPAYFDAGFSEFVLSYDDVRLADDPPRAILDFAQTTYEAGARLQHWPRDVLEWTPPTPPSHRRAMSTT